MFHLLSTLTRVTNRADQQAPFSTAARLNRRLLLGAGGAAALAFTVGLPNRAWAKVTDTTIASDPFTLGVASGDPLPDAVVLWTRLAPQPFEPYGGMDQNTHLVTWEIALDRTFSKGVRTGTAHAHPEFSHSVHVDVQGLRPGAEYFYRFRAGGHASEIARTKTAPAPGSRPTKLNFAFASCLNYGDGYYTALRHLAAEDLDVVLFLGDYIYEYGLDPLANRRNLTDPLPVEFADATITLDRYRLQYALYKSDPDLIAAHQAAPWIVTWDDHEVENDYCGLISGTNNEDTDFLVRRANAYRAYWEHLPLRCPQPDGPDMRLYRSYDFGRLAQFSVLDARQYRSNQMSGASAQPDSAARRDPSRLMLGTEQEQWLFDGLGKSSARWNIVPQQNIMSQLDDRVGDGELFQVDYWDGYYAARQRLTQTVVERDVDNFVVLTGDAHTNYAFDMRADFNDLEAPPIGTELVGTSITSGGDGADSTSALTNRLKENPHLHFANQQRGYVTCSVSPDVMQVNYRVLPEVGRPGAPISTRQSFVIEAGRPGLNAD